MSGSDSSIVQQLIDEKRAKIASNNQEIAAGNHIAEHQAENTDLEQDIAQLESKLKDLGTSQ